MGRRKGIPNKRKRHTERVSHNHILFHFDAIDGVINDSTDISLENFIDEESSEDENLLSLSAEEFNSDLFDSNFDETGDTDNADLTLNSYISDLMKHSIAIREWEISDIIYKEVVGLLFISKERRYKPFKFYELGVEESGIKKLKYCCDYCSAVKLKSPLSNVQYNEESKVFYEFSCIHLKALRSYLDTEPRVFELNPVDHKINEIQFDNGKYCCVNICIYIYLFIYVTLFLIKKFFNKDYFY